LIKLEKEFAFAGAVIPSVLEAGGERIPLRAFVFGMSKKRGRLTQDDTAEVDRVISVIRRRRREIVERLSREEMTRSGANELYAQAEGWTARSTRSTTPRCRSLPSRRNPGRRRWRTGGGGLTWCGRSIPGGIKGSETEHETDRTVQAVRELLQGLLHRHPRGRRDRLRVHGIPAMAGIPRRVSAGIKSFKGRNVELQIKNPCRHLVDNKDGTFSCAIHDNKPDICKRYPEEDYQDEVSSNCGFKFLP